MRLRIWSKGAPAPAIAVGAGPAAAALRSPITHRAFLKLLAGAAGAGALARLAGDPRPAGADYTEDPGWLGYDQVDRELRVNGNLLIQGTHSVTIGDPGGTSGALNVQGTICVGGVEAVDASGVVKKSYYAP